MTDKHAEAFTLVFRGDIRQFRLNPLTTETPWGIPYGVALGDALEEIDTLRAEIARCSDATSPPQPPLQQPADGL